MFVSFCWLLRWRWWRSVKVEIYLVPIWNPVARLDVGVAKTFSSLFQKTWFVAELVCLQQNRCITPACRLSLGHLVARLTLLCRYSWRLRVEWLPGASNEETSTPN